ncbi:beta-propeller fold lactonase family protein [Ralstonia sp. 3N]|jgi:YVTN family beta-propeller protein|nr:MULTISPECIES: beta-propeller fold lactonase family protein [unclassified Ralstonia]MBA9859215.1 YncE family protein [Ralstonia insidiosa]MBC9968063.1 beta-propeller fold lactonase family protein [Ralstonia insidiosa]MBX3904374.1 beta-propeller fold lactonase family protein [Ralstonia insidiosa]NPT52541.1 beta-propeller fold lactonase family protein [Ralstonia sp. 3N]SCW55800.1 40-residue YVTN family beta-propeller repeat-containing protein [Ralstonia sp. UNCCL144]
MFRRILGLVAAVAATHAWADYPVVVLNSAAANITLIDQSTRQVTETYAVGKEPHHLMPTPDGKTLLVANSVSNNLMFVDPKTGKVTKTLEGIEDPYQLGFSPDGKWFVTNGLRLDRVDIYSYANGNYTLAKRIPLGKTPSHMTFSSDSKLVFITLQDSNELAAIDLATQQVAWKMPVGKTPAGLWLTPHDQYLLIGMTGEDNVEVVDWRNRTIVKRIQTGRGAHNFRPANDGRHVFVTNRVDSTISLLDEISLTKVKDITGLRPGPDDMELTPDGHYLWVTFRFSKSVGVIDLTTDKLVSVIPVGRSPHGLYFYNRRPWMN